MGDASAHNIPSLFSFSLFSLLSFSRCVSCSLSVCVFCLGLGVPFFARPRDGRHPPANHTTERQEAVRSFSWNTHIGPPINRVSPATTLHKEEFPLPLFSLSFPFLFPLLRQSSILLTVLQNKYPSLTASHRHSPPQRERTKVRSVAQCGLGNDVVVRFFSPSLLPFFLSLFLSFVPIRLCHVSAHTCLLLSVIGCFLLCTHIGDVHWPLALSFTHACI